MSGSAKKRREKERRKVRRGRALVRWLGEMERRGDAAHAAFMRMVNMPRDPVPGFTHEIVFGVGRREPEPIRGTVERDGRMFPTEVLPISRST